LGVILSRPTRIEISFDYIGRRGYFKTYGVTTIKYRGAGQKKCMRSFGSETDIDPGSGESSENGSGCHQQGFENNLFESDLLSNGEKYESPVALVVWMTMATYMIMVCITLGLKTNMNNLIHK
jgi:hypothetical protein